MNINTVKEYEFILNTFIKYVYSTVVPLTTLICFINKIPSKITDFSVEQEKDIV